MADRMGLVVAPGKQMPAAIAVPRSATREPDPLKGGDVYEWATDQAALIRAGRYDETDWINVADEIEGVGKAEIRTLHGNAENVLLHMLKRDHQPERRTRSWSLSIRERRRGIGRDLSKNPGLKARLEDDVQESFELALTRATRETGLDLGRFPRNAPTTGMPS